MKPKIRSSRISFMSNYLLGISLLLLIFITNLIVNLPGIISYLFLVIAILLFLEPEGTIVHKGYRLDSDHVSEIKGVFIKSRTDIPYRAIVDHRLKKGVIGRFLNYGDVVISGPKIEIKMRGIRSPERIYKEIEKKSADLMASANPSLLG